MKNESQSLLDQLSYLANTRSPAGSTAADRAGEMLLDDLKYKPSPLEIMDGPFAKIDPSIFEKKPTSIDEISKSWVLKNNQLESLSDSKITTGRRGVTKRRVVVEKESGNDNQ
jgi:hypothetical protein